MVSLKMTKIPQKREVIVWTEAANKVKGAMVKWAMTVTYFSFPSSQASIGWRIYPGIMS